MSARRLVTKLEDFEQPNIITTTADFVFNWARSHSIFPLTYGTACCYVEVACALMSRYDMARFGWEVMRPSPRQADLMIVAGTINEKMAPVLRRLYDQMAEPKWVIAMGACAISGGVFSDGYNVVNGVDRIVPVDVYIPGCPPRPEALFQGILELQGRIDKARFVEDPRGEDLLCCDSPPRSNRDRETAGEEHGCDRRPDRSLTGAGRDHVEQHRESAECDG